MLKRIIRYIKSLLGKYEIGYEYLVRLSDIKIPSYYKKTKIGNAKWKRKLKYWRNTGQFESPILLHRDFTLIDGYSSVKIAKIKHIDKLPVYFVDTN